MYRSPDQLTVRVLCICSMAQCKLVNTYFFVVCLFFFCIYFFETKVLSSMKYGGELVANIGHCLFFTETNCTWKRFFLLCAVRRFDHSEWGVWLVVAVVAPLRCFIFRSVMGRSTFPFCTTSETNWLQICGDASDFCHHQVTCSHLEAAAAERRQLFLKNKQKTTIQQNKCKETKTFLNTDCLL